MAFAKGDILLPSNRVAKKNWLDGLFHPAVVWDDNYDGNSDFRGIMLTHSPPNGNFENILMVKDHFEPGHKIIFSQTHFINQVFMKFYAWGPFEMVGKLTPDGIAFIEGSLEKNSPPIEFLVYRNATVAKSN